MFGILNTGTDVKIKFETKSWFYKENETFYDKLLRLKFATHKLHLRRVGPLSKHGFEFKRGLVNLELSVLGLLLMEKTIPNPYQSEP